MLALSQRNMSSRRSKALPKLILWKSETRMRKKEWKTNIFSSIAYIHTKKKWKYPRNLKSNTAKGNSDLSPSNQGWKQSRPLCPMGICSIPAPQLQSIFYLHFLLYFTPEAYVIYAVIQNKIKQERKRVGNELHLSSKGAYNSIAITVLDIALSFI